MTFGDAFQGFLLFGMKFGIYTKLHLNSFENYQKSLKVTKDLQGYFVIFVKFVCIWYTYILNFILIGQKNKKKYQRSPKVTKVQFVYLVKIVYIKHTCITNFYLNWSNNKVKTTKGQQRSPKVNLCICLNLYT